MLIVVRCLSSVCRFVLFVFFSPVFVVCVCVFVVGCWWSVAIGCKLLLYVVCCLMFSCLMFVVRSCSLIVMCRSLCVAS